MTATSDANSVSDEDRTALTDTVTRFARTEIAPHVDAWDAAGEFPRSLYRRAADLGLLGLGAFFWCMRSGQFADLEGAAWRVLQDDDAAAPPPEKQAH